MRSVVGAARGRSVQTFGARHAHMKITFALLIVIILATISCSTDSRPDAKLALTYTATRFFDELISQLHDAKDDPLLKEPLARRYYGNLFMLWFGTDNPPMSKEIEVDLRANIRAFLRVAKECRFD